MLIDRQVLLRNIWRAQDYFDTHGVKFRPHMKTHKTPQIGRLQVEAGAVGGSKIPWPHNPAVVGVTSGATVGQAANIGFSPEGSVYYSYAADNQVFSINTPLTAAQCAAVAGTATTAGGGLITAAYGNLDGNAVGTNRFAIADAIEMMDCTPGVY